jgi:hypothetical protein
VRAKSSGIGGRAWFCLGGNDLGLLGAVSLGERPDLGSALPGVLSWGSVGTTLGLEGSFRGGFDVTSGLPGSFRGGFDVAERLGVDFSGGFTAGLGLAALGLGTTLGFCAWGLGFTAGLELAEALGFCA